MKSGRVLVVFGAKLPRKQVFDYDCIIAPATLEPEVRAKNVAFETLESLVDPGSIEEATAFLHELATATLPDGTRVSESITYQGYELWWVNYDELYVRQCLPYTQYRRLLAHLKEYSNITLEAPPAAALFYIFLQAHGCRYSIQGNVRRFPPVGIWLQVFISLVSWPVLMLMRPKIMMYTGDLFDPPRDHSFRMRLIYDELRARKLPFIEFIRSLEPVTTVLAHAGKRRRPVIYSYAIKVVIVWLFGRDTSREPLPRASDPERAFKLALASTSLGNVQATIWCVRVMTWFIRSIGVRAALIPSASSRTFHEVLGCRLAKIPTIGILHGAASKYYNVYDFMPEYRGAKRLSLDVYGMWSQWWRDYYLANGKAYTADQLVVSGPMRPLTVPPVPRVRARHGALRVLFIAEQLAEPGEILPYLEALMQAEGLELFFKFRSYSDGFEEWLKVQRPDLLERVDSAHILRGTMPDAIAHADVVVGSHSTAVLEALLSLTPIVFFYTKKWGDYFSLEPMNARYGIFAKNPKQLIEYVVQSKNAPEETLKELRDMFFGDPYKNGSAWVVDELQKHL